MNGYEYRAGLRRANRSKYQQAQKLDASLMIDRTMRDYEDAWFDLHKCRVAIEYKHGRYYVHGKGVFRSDLLFMTMQLQAQKHEQELYAET